MKSLFNLRSIVLVFAVIVFAGCSGITEATLPDADNSSISSTNTEVLHQEVSDFIESNETNVPTIIPHVDTYKDRP
jgi:hypothetical protein